MKMPGAGAHAAECHCWHAATRDEALRKGKYLHGLYGAFINLRHVVELGCGEGAILLWLKEHDYAEVYGVDSNPELCALARSFGMHIEQADILQHLRSASLAPAVYLYLDVIEHVPFEMNAEVMDLLPVGSRLILQTPYTRSIKGHEFYMNVPSHLAPYSPWVIGRMLERAGYRIVRDGTVEGNHPPTWMNKLRALFIRKVLGIDPELLLGGANYFVVADRVESKTAE